MRIPLSCFNLCINAGLVCPRAVAFYTKQNTAVVVYNPETTMVPNVQTHPHLIRIVSRFMICLYYRPDVEDSVHVIFRSIRPSIVGATGAIWE